MRTCSGWGPCRTRSAAWLPDARALSVADVLRLAAGDDAGRVDWAALQSAGRQALTTWWRRANAKARAWPTC
jgi:hypothetical protein